MKSLFWFLYFSIVLLILVFILSFGKAGQAAACGCTRPTPTPTPIITPSMTPTPTMTPEATPSATPKVPENKNTGSGGGGSSGSYSPPVCIGVYPDMPLLQGFKVIDETTDRYSWWAPVSGVDKYAVIYGYSPDSLIYGIDNLNREATSIDIGALRPNTQTWLQVWAFKGECVTKSVIFN